MQWIAKRTCVFLFVQFYFSVFNSLHLFTDAFVFTSFSCCFVLSFYFACPFHTGCFFIPLAHTHTLTYTQFELYFTFQFLFTLGSLFRHYNFNAVYSLSFFASLQPFRSFSFAISHSCNVHSILFRFYLFDSDDDDDNGKNNNDTMATKTNVIVRRVLRNVYKNSVYKSTGIFNEMIFIVEKEIFEMLSLVLYYSTTCVYFVCSLGIEKRLENGEIEREREKKNIVWIFQVYFHFICERMTISGTLLGTIADNTITFVYGQFTKRANSGGS